MKEEIWKDIDCVIRYKIEENRMDFEVFEIVGHGKDEKTGEYTVAIYEKKGGTSSDDNTENLDEAQTLLKGLIKWDACSHVTFGDEEGYIHLCGGHSWFNFIEATKRVYGIAIKELSQEHSKDMFNVELFTNQETNNSSTSRINI